MSCRLHFCRNIPSFFNRQEQTCSLLPPLVLQGKAWYDKRMTDHDLKTCKKTEFVENVTILHRFQSFQYLSHVNSFISGSIPIEMNNHAHV